MAEQTLMSTKFHLSHYPAKMQVLRLEALSHLPFSPDTASTGCENLDNFSFGKLIKSQNDVETSFQNLIDSCTPHFDRNGIGKLLTKYAKYRS